MTFENIVKTISSFFATVIIYIFALGIYLSSKGFVLDSNGDLVLVNSAMAKPALTAEEKKKEEEKMKTVHVDTPHFLGVSNAPVTMYEYSSFGCAHCSDFHLSTLQKIKKDYVETGKLKLVFVDFPLEKKSMQAAMISYCIPADKYFEFLDMVFKNQNDWMFSMRTENVLTTYAGLFGVNAQKAQECLKDEKVQNRILANRQQGIEAFKIQGTPSFILENKDKREVLYGASSYEEFQKAIDSFIPVKKVDTPIKKKNKKK